MAACGFELFIAGAMNVCLKAASRHAGTLDADTQLGSASDPSCWTTRGPFCESKVF
jgi:hypothetical protein